MVDALILETSFLADLERELIAGSSGPAQIFLQTHQAQKLHITFTIAGEWAAGPRMSERTTWERRISLRGDSMYARGFVALRSPIQVPER